MGASFGPQSAESDPSTALPSGTVTFLFTDIEGSTGRWERTGVVMAEAVRRHDALMRAAIRESGGHVFKTVGDAFCAAFGRPQDAIAAAAAAQRGLAAQDFSAIGGLAVRMAVHTGTADERDGDYFGQAVNRVARILSVGNGGQILVSGVTADLSVADLPPQTTMRDLGAHRLRDLERPEQIYQLILRDVAVEFPPLRSLDRLPNNLPVALTPLIGRADEVREITDLLATQRVVTIVGSGGVGKTRVSLAVAANVLDVATDGVWFVELAPVSDGDLVPATIAAAIGVALSGNDHMRALQAALAEMRLVLILDNCEHLVDAVARVVARIAGSCPHVTVLASSRQPFGIDGERPYRMPSLGVPPAAESLTVEDAAGYDAIALFCERAQVADRRFSLNRANVAAVAEICTRLDGIPLAIELAAARVTVLSPAQLLARLDERFRLLTGASRSALPRQQTLRALIDWSYELLSEPERLLFDRFSTFVGACTLDAATEVCGGPGFEEVELFDVLASLIDKSLIVSEADDYTSRYRMLESMRAYAGERLAKRGETDLLITRHLRFYHALAQAAHTASESTGRESDYAPVIAELDNIRVAIDRSLRGMGEVGIGAELVSFIPWSLWSLREVAERLRNFAQREIADPCIAARVWIALRAPLFNLGDRIAAREASANGMHYAQICGQPAILLQALMQHAQSEARDQRPDEAARLMARALPLNEECGDAGTRLRFLFCQTYTEFHRGGYATSARLLRELLALHRSLGNKGAELLVLTNLGCAEYGAGNYEVSAEILRETQILLERSRQFDHALNVASFLVCALVAAERFADAYEAGRRAVSMRPEFMNDFHAAILVKPIAIAHAAEGRVPVAVRLCAFARTGLARNGYVSELVDVIVDERLEVLLRSLDPAEREAFERTGAELTYPDALRLAYPEPC